jgi:hypothetical protein
MGVLGKSQKRISDGSVSKDTSRDESVFESDGTLHVGWSMVDNLGERHQSIVYRISPIDVFRKTSIE